MKEAIRKAIEGGYGFRNYVPMDAPDDFVKIPYKEIDSILLDPLFWQALGKAMGWQEYDPDYQTLYGVHNEWQYQWHRFIDHLASGGDAESFFKELLK